nr:PREDICTED: uncharacterized protein LOC109033132 [Bemisia tabaci]
MPFYETGSTASLYSRVRGWDHGQSLCFCTQHRPSGVHNFDSSYRAYGCRSLTTPPFLLFQKKFHLCTSPYLVPVGHDRLKTIILVCCSIRSYTNLSHDSHLLLCGLDVYALYDNCQ